MLNGLPCEWHCTHRSTAFIESSRTGLMMFKRLGVFTCSAPGPWHFSHPTFHSVTVFVWML